MINSIANILKYTGIGLCATGFISLGFHAIYKRLYIEGTIIIGLVLFLFGCLIATM